MNLLRRLAGVILALVALLVAVAAAVAVGVAFGYYAAWHTSRLDPIEALHHE